MSVWDYLWATALLTELCDFDVVVSKAHGEALPTTIECAACVCVLVQSNPQASKHCKPSQWSDEAHTKVTFISKVCSSRFFQISRFKSKREGKPAGPVSDEAEQ